MAFTFNGNIPENVIFNNNEVLVIKWNGTTVWEKNNEDYSTKYLTFVAKTSGSIKFSGSTTSNKIQFSTDDGLTWASASRAKTVSVSAGDVIMWKGSLTASTSTSTGGIGRFSGGTASFDVYGNIASLIYSDNFANQIDLTATTRQFQKLFYNCKVVNAENLYFPYKTMGYYSCYAMFYGCTSLTTAPELTATTLGDYCYQYMFYGCTSLTQAPSKLPSLVLKTNCYQYMFQGCTNLETAPIISANRVSSNSTGCCYNMFALDSKLKNVQSALYSTTITERMYFQMFYHCTSLVQAPMILATTLNGTGCCLNMFQGCTSLTTAQELPATTLVQSCYQGMFKGCSNLNYIKMLATDISATDCLTDWVDGVSNSGTFVKAASMTSLPSGTSGIPDGWTVQDASS